MARRWYVLRVQSGRENRARDAVERRIREAGLSHVVTKVIVPTETITEIKSGKKRVQEKKLYPGYVMVEMDIDDDVETAEEAIYLVRETPGVSDFIGVPGRPVAMSDQEVDKMIGQAERAEGVEPEIQINVRVGQAVKIKEGHFESFDGVIEEVNPSKGTVKVVIDIFGRPTPVDLEHWQVEPI